MSAVGARTGTADMTRAGRGQVHRGAIPVHDPRETTRSHRPGNALAACDKPAALVEPQRDAECASPIIPWDNHVSAECLTNLSIEMGEELSV